MTMNLLEDASSARIAQVESEKFFDHSCMVHVDRAESPVASVIDALSLHLLFTVSLVRCHTGRPPMAIWWT
jgi:hypothetical protein